jgi:DNA-binding NtrC family response regulator
MGSAEILFVEDDRSILDLGIDILRDAGYEAVPAVNGDIALILLEQGLPFRVLITDVILPGTLDGFALAHRAKALRPRIEIIYATGFPDVAGIRSRGAPWGRTLIKPWGARDLLKLVEPVLAPPA